MFLGLFICATDYRMTPWDAKRILRRDDMAKVLTFYYSALAHIEQRARTEAEAARATAAQHDVAAAATLGRRTITKALPVHLFPFWVSAAQPPLTQDTFPD